MTGEPKSSYIKTKIMLGFSLVICGVIFVGFIAYKSFDLLVGSIDQIAQPDKEITILNNIVRDLAEAEIALKESTLGSAKKTAFDSFTVYMERVQEQVDSLRHLSPDDPERITKLDTINDLINEKLIGAKGFRLLIRTKTDYFNKALEEITSKGANYSLIDSLYSQEDSTVSTVDSALTLIDSLAGQLQTKPKKRFLASKRKKMEDSILQAKEKAKAMQKIEQFIGEVNKAKEKEVVSNLQPAVETDTVKKIISDLQLEDQISENKITQKELEIIKNNSLILTKVKSLIKVMEKKESTLHTENINNARKTANSAILIIIATGIVGTFSGIMFIYIIFNDITRRNFYRKQLDKAREKAVNEAKAKEEFLANMSHEIRTPLNAILGFSEQLDNTPLKATQKNYLNAVRNSSSHLLSTVNDVLDFSKIQANKLSIEKIPFKLINVVKEVCVTLQLKAEQKNIGLRYSFDDKLSQVLVGDPFRLKQILLNLVNNGLKFTESGYVEVKVSAIKDFKNKVISRIEVIDTGIGIAPENISKIFEGFSQSDSSTTRKYGGTGLGLTISKKLVELQQGTLEVESTEGEGSAFIITMTFDKAKDFVEVQKESSSLIDNNIFESLKILVIDDDNLNLQLCQIIFNNWNLDADFYSNGRDALASAEKNSYDLIITDIQMPELSGIDLSKHIRSLADEAKSKTPILAFTANVMKDDIEKYLDSGINDYLLKPFKEIQLHNKIVSMLHLSKPKKADNNATKSVTPKAKLNGQSKAKLYSIDEIIQFTGERNESLLEVLESFINNSTSSLLMLDSGMKKKDWEKIKVIAHKMLPSFQHLKVNSVIPELKKLERLNGHIKASEIEPLVQKIETDAGKVIKSIRREVIQLKKELSARQTS